MLDDQFVYGFVRQDISPELQLQQFGHAMHLATQRIAALQGDGVPHLITFGIAHPKALTKVIKTLEEINLNYFPYTDPDKLEVGVTAIVTAPATEAQRAVLKKYRMYNSKETTHVPPIEDPVFGLGCHQPTHS